MAILREGRELWPKLTFTDFTTFVVTIFQENRPVSWGYSARSRRESRNDDIDLTSMEEGGDSNLAKTSGKSAGLLLVPSKPGMFRRPSSNEE